MRVHCPKRYRLNGLIIITGDIGGFFMFEIGKCVRCKTPLVEKKCFICGGDGKIGKEPSSVTCSVCSGRGKILTCPNSAAHFLEDLKLRTPLRTITPDKARNFNFSLQSIKPKGNENIMDLLRKYKVPPPGLNVPPWDHRYKFPWHPHHPRNPIRLNMSYDAARKAAELARKKKPFQRY